MIQTARTAVDVTTTRYSVGIFGPRSQEKFSILEATLHRRLSELSAELDSVVRFLDAEDVAVRDPKIPVVGVYFGGGNPSTADVQAAKSLVASSCVVIPVVGSLEHYTSEVPSELIGINGSELSDDDPQLDSIANLVLENLGLLRRTRRLFISYRRTESTREALQLRQELDERGYDVFLDTHSVPKGDDFQEVLWQRLADSDVAILLDTPGFISGRWTKEELAQAEAMTVGLVQIIWPGHVPVPYTDLCERIYLSQEDFDNEAPGGLHMHALVRIAVAVEKLRARCLAARHNNLVREFCDAAASVNVFATVQPERFISAQVKSGQLVAIPAVGVPDALRYHEASRRFSETGNKELMVFLIYDQRGLRPTWSAFLDWLDDFLPVKAVRITGVAKRLTEL